MVVNASLQRSPPSSSYEIVVVVLKVARFCARACVLCISTDESRNLWGKGTLKFFNCVCVHYWGELHENTHSLSLSATIYTTTTTTL